ncbi:MAG: AraC family transcriptional regulator [Planctomycetota bacterium]
MESDISRPPGNAELASATGFCDRYHFSRVFRKLRGVSPARFRKRFYGTRGGISRLMAAHPSV